MEGHSLHVKSGSAMVCLLLFSERFPHKNASLKADPLNDEATYPTS